MPHRDVDVAQSGLRIRIAAAKLLAQGPNRGAVRDKAIALKGHARIAVEAVGAGILNAELDFVTGGQAVGLDQSRQHNHRAVRGKIPTAAAAGCRRVLTLRHTDRAAISHAPVCAFRKRISATINAAAVVVPLIEISGKLPGRIEIKECGLGRANDRPK